MEISLNNAIGDSHTGGRTRWVGLSLGRGAGRWSAGGQYVAPDTKAETRNAGAEKQR